MKSSNLIEYLRNIDKGICEVFYKNQSFSDVCCDCGLQHINKIVSLTKMEWEAVRPEKYKYKMRLKDDCKK